MPNTTTRLLNSPSRKVATRPVLRFSPTAWAKLLFLRDRGNTEVGGFGIAAEDDLLLITDVQLVRQRCSWEHVAFDDNAVADFFDVQVDQGRRPEQFGRLWLHTHPDDCPQPSLTDEETFERVFGRATWAVMFIVARTGPTYARLRFNVGPGGEIELPVEVDYRQRFPGCDWPAWEQEYLSNVTRDELMDVDLDPRQHLRRLWTTGIENEELLDPFFFSDLWEGVEETSYARRVAEERIGACVHE